ncbi:MULTISPECIES: hypothetical protein [unclassified Cryobacterium]|uniref:hypothetical protein n=1 Tax=unclassified Cryobacterium TaxID=2649013 RepID=UPI00106A464E|nr:MULTISPECIES: hypothetical protein [unclassified Cryobacterium]TFB97672.1 hypothetical protein E3O39_07620 [Cryobacterium sp. MDB2-A-1]TFC07792.1 hypothetical protein E3O35_18250 [Cryobacterium sp. MDB2-A-2]TFC21024.1 hypothetical protein E3O51_04780 [Cryobacterium sp. MDB2-10]
MVQVTERDLAMVEWLGVVRLAEVDAIRWALGAMLGSAEPISTRKAQHWIMRMVEAGLVARARPTFQGASIVWATHDAVGRQPPNLFRQTTRHEVAVATVSARYLALGYTWQRDRRPISILDHQADGIATREGRAELVEVELTAKSTQRYMHIYENYSTRLAREGVSRVAYYCTADADRVVSREADRFIFRTERQRLVSTIAFDERGHWIGNSLSLTASFSSCSVVQDAND